MSRCFYILFIVIFIFNAEIFDGLLDVTIWAGCGRDVKSLG
jgi:hypothetical protein